MDNISSSRRSENMRRIRSKNTKPELIIRKLVRSIGYTGYRIHRKDIPGKPDLAWINRKLAIFVNGCFWHGHSCKEGIRKPKSRKDYWISKIEKNCQRDIEQLAKLDLLGWKVLLIWECDLSDLNALESKINLFFEEDDLLVQDFS